MKKKKKEKLNSWDEVYTSAKAISPKVKRENGKKKKIKPTVGRRSIPVPRLNNLVRMDKEWSTSFNDLT